PHPRDPPPFPTRRSSDLKRKSSPLASVSSHFPDLEWGKYRTAVEWWESIFRPAPKPTEVRPNGRHRLSVEFPEWMMGLEPGHVSDRKSTRLNSSHVKISY